MLDKLVLNTFMYDFKRVIHLLTIDKLPFNQAVIF